MKIIGISIFSIILAAATALLISAKTAKPPAPAGLRVEIAKKDRKLSLYSNGKLIHTYRIGLGSAPEGDKTQEGDRRTPEGEYYVCSKNPQSKFHLSLGLSYPNLKDVARGLKEKRITKAQYNDIARALRKKARPPWNTPLGGEIFLHGNGSKTDWTWGCIALDDADIRQLYNLVPVGTPVIIRP